MVELSAWPWTVQAILVPDSKIGKDRSVIQEESQDHPNSVG